MNPWLQAHLILFTSALAALYSLGMLASVGAQFTSGKFEAFLQAFAAFTLDVVKAADNFLVMLGKPPTLMSRRKMARLHVIYAAKLGEPFKDEADAVVELAKKS